MGTIVQEYGPIYGEAVNGTVQGRPNGSVYVPLSNKISMTPVTAGTITLARTNPAHPTRVYSNIGMNIIAESQDLASSILYGIFTDSDCTTNFGTMIPMPAGYFNLAGLKHMGNSTADPTTGTTYYLRAFLMNNGVAVAASDVIEVVGG